MKLRFRAENVDVSLLTYLNSKRHEEQNCGIGVDRLMCVPGFSLYEPFDSDTSRYRIAANDSALLVFTSPDLCPVCKAKSRFSFFEDTLYFFSNDSVNNPVRIFARGEGHPSAVSGHSFNLPIQYSLFQSYPNPFVLGSKTAGSPSVTVITFLLPKTQTVEVSIYDLLGQKVAILVKGILPAGKRQAIWNGRNENGEHLPSGIYFYSLIVDQTRVSKKLLLIE